MAQRNRIQLHIAGVGGVNENSSMHLWLVFMKLYFLKSILFRTGQFLDILYGEKKGGGLLFFFLKICLKY